MGYIAYIQGSFSFSVRAMMPKDSKHYLLYLFTGAQSGLKIIYRKPGSQKLWKFERLRSTQLTGKQNASIILLLKFKSDKFYNSNQLLNITMKYEIKERKL